MAVRTAGDPEQVIARVEVGSRKFSGRKLSVTESYHPDQSRNPLHVGFLIGFSATIKFMVSAIITLFSVFCLLSLAEYLRYKKVLHGEIARKFVHITVGAFVSTWPHYMSLLSIEIICLAFLGGVLITRHLKILHSIHAVERKTWGDILFPIGIGLTAILAANPWIFTAAVLHLSLADGTAALIGERYIRAGKYNILGQIKSKVGTLVFWFVSFMILSTLILTQQPGLSFAAIPILLGLTTAATIVENAAPMGTDNILVPFVVTAVLNFLV